MSSTSVAISRQDHSLIDLTRLLARLDRNLLSPQIDPALRRSSYQRTRVGANIEYAHSLILRLEHANATSKSQNQKTRVQTELQQKRVLLKKLQDRLYELGQLDDEQGDDWPSDATEDEDLLATYAPAVKREVEEEKEPDKREQSGQGQPASIAESQLRARRQAQNGAADRATTSGAAFHDDARTALLGKSTTPIPPAKASRSDGEVLLSHHASEQEALTSSLLNLATALKTSTQSFSDTLSSSNPLVDRATTALDRNVTGMEGAERRMGMLRRMTEGKGWWGRISLYAWIGVLWVALILIMFVMPKLPF